MAARCIAPFCFSRRMEATGQASENNANCLGAAGLGLRGRFDDAGFRYAVGKIGAVICWENYLPLMRAAMYAKGIEIYCAPTADPRDSWIASMRHIAVEGRCFVLSCNQFNRQRDFPGRLCRAFGDDPDAIVTRAGVASSIHSGIFSPDLTLMAK